MPLHGVRERNSSAYSAAGVVVFAGAESQRTTASRSIQQRNWHPRVQAAE